MTSLSIGGTGGSLALPWRQMTRRALNLAVGAPLLAALLSLAAAASARAITFTPCPDDHSLGCAHVSVALDHAGKTPGTLALNVRRLLAGSTQSTNAVIGVAGGPVRRRRR